jgi:hypothetical protein
MATTKSQQDERTAYHEAGHAVLQWACNVGLKHVTIVPGEGTYGHSIDGGEWGEYDDQGHPVDKDAEDAEALRMYAPEAFWIRMAMVRYAGAEAVRRLRPISRWRAGASSDYQQAVDALLMITEDEESVNALCRYAKRRARVLVEHYWPEIECLAKALRDRKSIEGDVAGKIILDCIDSRHGARQGY